MLGLYRYTLIIGHTLYNMLSMLNELTLHRELHNFVPKCVFDKNVKPQQQQNTKLNIKILASAGNQTHDLLHQRRRRYL